MDVAHKQLVAVLLAEGVGQIESRAAVGRLVVVIADRLDVVVDERIDVTAGLAMEHAALDDVPQMWNHAGRGKQPAVLVEIHAPGVGTPVPGGLNLRESHLLCESIAATKKLLGIFF